MVKPRFTSHPNGRYEPDSPSATAAQGRTEETGRAAGAMGYLLLVIIVDEVKEHQAGFEFDG